MLTISKLKRWSINYYIATAQAADNAARDLARTGGGLEEYYSERETHTPTWLLADDTHTVSRLGGITDDQRVGGDADAELVTGWLDDGITPNGAHRHAFGQRDVHGFDLTFCAPKSVSLVSATARPSTSRKKKVSDLTSLRSAGRSAKSRSVDRKEHLGRQPGESLVAVRERLIVVQ